MPQQIRATLSSPLFFSSAFKTYQEMEVTTMAMRSVSPRHPPPAIARDGNGFLKGSPLPSRRVGVTVGERKNKKGRMVLVVEAKGKNRMMSRQSERPQMPAMPKLADDGNPNFVIFIRTANVYLWYPLSIVTGGTTAKIMVAAKDNFLGKYIYRDTLNRNLAAVIYKDEKEVQKKAANQYRVLRSATEFRYGYKLVENGNMRAALSTNNVIELPKKEELKTVLDKVKEFIDEKSSNAKESFGKLASLGAIDEKPEAEAEVEG